MYDIALPPRAEPIATLRRKQEYLQRFASERMSSAISDEAATMMLMAIADSPDDAPPSFMPVPFTDEESLAGIEEEVGQLGHFGCVAPQSIADAAADPVIDARCPHRRRGPHEVRCRLVAAKRGWGVVVAPTLVWRFFWLRSPSE